MTRILIAMILLKTKFIYNSFFYKNFFICNFFIQHSHEGFRISQKSPLRIWTENLISFWSVKPVWFITSFVFFSFASLLFSAGFIGLFFNNKNFLLILLKAETMFLGLNLWFIGFSIYNSNYTGYVYALLLFGLVAAESAIGLTLFLVFFFFKKTIMTDIFIYSPDEIRSINAKIEHERYWNKKRRKTFVEFF